MAQPDQKPSEGKLFNTGLISCKQPSVLVLNGSGIAENWRRWKQNFDIYMKASGFNKQSSDIKVAILLNSIGEDAVELYNTFNLSELEREDFDKVIEAFDAYANPRKNVVVERYVFNLRKQAFGETFDTFVTDLKKLVKNCEYGTQMESVIRDRIVLGILDKNLQERLLREADLTLEKAIEVCKASEISRQQAETIQNTTNVCKVTRTPNSLEKKSYNNKNKVANPTPNFKMKGKTNENRYYSSDVYLCKKCNTKHKYAKCPAFGKRCNLCKKENHFAVGCRKNKRNVSELNSDNSADCVVIDTITRGNQMEWNQIIKVGQNKICCKLDSGAQVNLISEKLLRTVSDEIVLKPTSIMLETFGGNKLRPVGLVELKCTMGEEKLEKIIEFVVVSCKNEVKPILGLDTCVKLGLLSKRDVNVVDISSKEKFIEMNKDIFEGVGKFTNKCSIKIAENCQPVARLPRRVPESLKGKLKEKLDSLEKEKIISRVDNPEDWVSNLVIVEKPDGTIRLCLDPQDLNKAIKREFVLIPTMEELIPKLCNKGCYTVLDLKDGFYQMELDSNSSKLCQFCTPFGVYKFERLPFGIKSAPEIFQKQNLKNFGDIPGVSIYIDDLLVAGETVEEHDKILNQVAERARALNIKFNPKKLQYRMSEVKYLGHVFNKNGIKPDPDQVKAIKSIDTPNNKKELQRILGMINYLRKFIPDMSTITAPLRELLKNNTEFIWLPVHSKALNVLKQMISNSPVLRKFDNNKEIVLQCDSSKDGLGCTLLQEGQPVAFASRGLNDAEKRYAQIEKEFLSIVFATKKFHNYIYGNKVIVHNDHKPLVSIMNKNVANIMSNRLQRMKVKLLKYDLELKYVPGKWLYVADLLSRSYDTHETDNDEFLNEIVHCVKATKHLQVSKEKLQMFRNATSEDPILKKLVELYIKGWPDKKHDLPENLRYYFKLKDDLFADDGILFLGNKIFVPLKLRSDMLKKLHEGHFGIEKTKSRARQIMYWPGIYNDIENLISKCSVCEKFQPQNCKEPMKQHEIPELPFEKVGMDICEFGGKDYLCVIDYLSKWIELVLIRNKQAGEIINKLKVIFSSHGIPRIIVADNMPFNSYEFGKFARDWDIEVITSSPIYPKSNGQAESCVKIAKNMLKKCSVRNEDINVALMECRNTPLKGLDISPAQILLSRRLRTKIPIKKNLLVPEAQQNVKQLLEERRKKSRVYYNQSAKPLPPLKPGENVVVRKGKEWEPAKITRMAHTPRSYWVKDQNNRLIRRNRFHLRRSGNEAIWQNTEDTEPENTKPKYRYHDSSTELAQKNGQNRNLSERELISDNMGQEVRGRADNNEFYTTRSGRVVKPPLKLNL